MRSAGRRAVRAALVLTCLLGQTAALAQEATPRALPAIEPSRRRSVEELVLARLAAQPRRSAAVPAPTARPEASQTQAEARLAEQSRPWPRVLLSAALAASAGTLAWWSAHQADLAYERYRHAAGRQRQQDQFRRSERYDRFAGAGFAAMETGLVLTAYWTFF